MAASRAYRDAGFAASSGNSAEVLASRTLRKVQVAARLAELRAEQAKPHEVTIDSLAREFDENRAHALRVDQVAAAVQATAMKAKLFGFMIDRQPVQVEHTLRKPSADENVLAEMRDRKRNDSRPTELNPSSRPDPKSNAPRREQTFPKVGGLSFPQAEVAWHDA
jgi:hypothetical protein